MVICGHITTSILGGNTI